MEMELIQGLKVISKESCVTEECLSIPHKLFQTASTDSI